jgi:hypothetical protein
MGAEILAGNMFGPEKRGDSTAGRPPAVGSSAREVS